MIYMIYMIYMFYMIYMIYIIHIISSSLPSSICNSFSLHLAVSPGFHALRAAEEERQVEGRVAVWKLFGTLGRINKL
jgi:hypothetical protein